MLAKLIVYAPDRAQAIARMHRALLELTIDGIDTSRDFHLRVMENDEFRAGAIEIQWLERHLAALTASPAPHESVVRAAIAAVLLSEWDRGTPRPAATTSSDSAPAAPAGSHWLEVARREALR
jgi:acetyl-CoA carboxylase biotin carboxylase subunit